MILDLHGAPGGQTGKNIDDSANDHPELFRDPKYQDRTVKLWTEIARRYKDEPARNAHTLQTRPWTINVEGEVARPQVIDIELFARGDRGSTHDDFLTGCALGNS